MKIKEITENLSESKPKRADCLSHKKLSASWKASCKSRGLIPREGKKSHKIGDKRITVDGKKIKGGAYGGPLPTW